MNLETSLCREPILQYPNFDNFDKPFILTTDASGYAIGKVLSQGLPGKDLSVAYASILSTRKKDIQPKE